MFGRLAMGVSGFAAAAGALRLSWPATRRALGERRDRRLRRLVSHVYRMVPHYRRLFDDIPNEQSGKYLAYYPLFGSTAEGAPDMEAEPAD